ncbi:MAG: hypothetical protein KDI46_04565 [Alphaproteobacteria bacterium]|nr:hypothetical protein [Alphaproteobacteria bacterium]
MEAADLVFNTQEPERDGPADNDAVFDLEPSPLMADLFSRPVHVGLDSRSENDRNRIVIELERMGMRRRSGLRPQVLIPERRNGSLALLGDLDGDREAEEERRAVLERFLAAMAYYDALYYQTLTLVQNAMDQTDQAIEVLDQQIEIIEADQNPAEKLMGNFNPDSPAQKLKDRRSRLKNFRDKTLRAHQETLQSKENLPSEEQLNKIQIQINKETAELDISALASANPKAAKTKGKSGKSKAGKTDDEDEKEKPPMPDLGNDGA